MISPVVPSESKLSMSLLISMDIDSPVSKGDEAIGHWLVYMRNNASGLLKYLK